MEQEILDVGDKVKHPKFGTGTVTQRLGDTEAQKVIVKFGAEFGEKKLVTRLANMKRISERPTLAAAPGAPGTFPGAAAPAAAALPPKPARPEDDDDDDAELPVGGTDDDEDEDDELGDDDVEDAEDEDEE